MQKNSALPHIVVGLFVVLLMPAVTAKSDRPPYSYSTNGVLSSGKAYSLLISESAYVRREGEPGDDGSQWGIDGGFPRTNVSTFNLVVDGRNIWIPKKIYNDLSYVRSATVYEFGGGLRIDMKGSDAAGSFRTSFLFSGWTIERFTNHGEFPSSRWDYIVVHSSVAAIEDDSKPPIPPSTRSLRPASHLANK